MDPVKAKTSMIHFSEAHFEKNLTALKNTQESIQSLSSWCLQNKHHHKKIVACWFKVLKKVKMENRLVLFYLANDVIQYSKRKNLDFVNTWALIIQRAVPLVRDEKIKPNIQRIFRIWSERGVYDETFIADLTGLLESSKGVLSETAKLMAEFQPMKLIDKIRSCKVLEDDTDLKLSVLKKSALELTDVEALRNNLKDRRHGADHVTDVEEGIIKMEAYVASLREEIADRAKLIEFLEQGSIFYEHQKGDAKIVVTAYKNFGNKVKTLKRKLDELIPTLPSPIPSPDIDAPSPSPDSDTELQLPGEAPEPTSRRAREAEYYNMMMSNCQPSLGMGSFMGSGSLPFDIKANLFQESSSSNSNDIYHKSAHNVVSNSSEGNRIEVIDTRNKSEFDISDFLKSLGQPAVLAAESQDDSIPGLEGTPIAISNRQELVAVTTQAENSNTYSQVDTFNQSLYSMFSAPPPPPPANTASTDSAPLLPPPAPPELFLQDSCNQWGEGYGEMLDHSADWNSKLPPKFPTWENSGSNWEEDSPTDWEGPTDAIPKLLETPMSPPMFEKEGFNEPVQYDDTVGVIPQDIDHRNLSLRGGKKDVDHRNLISLTKSSPRKRTNKGNWSKDMDMRVLGHSTMQSKNKPSASADIPSCDVDYRQPLGQVEKGTTAEKGGMVEEGGTADIVESVDMEMSDDEDEARKLQHDKYMYKQASSVDKKKPKAATNQPDDKEKLPNSNSSIQVTIQQNASPIVTVKPFLSEVTTPRSLIPSGIQTPVQSPVTPPQVSKHPLLPTPQPLMAHLITTPMAKSDKSETVSVISAPEGENGNEKWGGSKKRTSIDDDGHDNPRHTMNKRNPRNHAYSPAGNYGRSGGYRGGSYRPYRGGRRGNFPRW